MVSVLVFTLVAAQPRWGLTFKSPDGCLSPAELAEKIERRLGHPTFGALPELIIEGHLEADGPKAWRARLTLVDAGGAVKGSREVTARGASCHSIDDSLVLVAAVMIDPSAALGVKAAPPPAVERAEPPRVAREPSEPLTPRIDAPPIPPKQDWPGYVLVEDDSTFSQSGRWMSRSTFYRVMGREDLEDAYTRRVLGRSLAYVLGSIAITGGVVLSLMQPLNLGCGSPCSDAPKWPIVSGLVALGAGLVAIIIASAVPQIPSTLQEDRAFADAYNAKLEPPPAQPVTARF